MSTVLGDWSKYICFYNLCIYIWLCSAVLPSDDASAAARAPAPAAAAAAGSAVEGSPAEVAVASSAETDTHIIWP